MLPADQDRWRSTSHASHSVVERHVERSPARPQQPRTRSRRDRRGRVEDPRLERQMAARGRRAIRRACAATSVGERRPRRRRRPSRTRRAARRATADPAVVAGLRAEQHRHVENVRPIGPSVPNCEVTVARGLARHPALAGTEPEHVVPRRRVAQRAHVVAAVGDRKHAGGEGDGGAATAAAGGARVVVRVERGAEHRR